MNTKNEYIRKMQAKLEELSIEIDKLTARKDEIKADVKVEYDEMIAALKVKLDGARLKTEELKHAGEHAWEDLKTGIDAVKTSIGEAIESARSRFK